MSDMKPLLRVEDLVVRFSVGTMLKTQWIVPVDRVSFEIAPGEVLSLVGESGSGKSTIGRTIVGFNRAHSGHIYVNDEDVTNLQGRGRLQSLRKTIQMIFQDPFGSLNPVKTVEQHLGPVIKRHQNVHGAVIQERIEQLLERVGIPSDKDFMAKYPYELSGGQRQRIAIARALAVQPNFIVADEPISMLDVSIRADILRLLNQLKQEMKMAFLFITHDLASARYFGDKIMVLYGGRVMEMGTSNQVIGNPQNPYTQLLLESSSGYQNTKMIDETSIESPNLSVERKGCVFAHRCPLVMDICRTKEPTLSSQADEHLVACHNVSKDVSI